jgi:hypothetical protein
VKKILVAATFIAAIVLAACSGPTPPAPSPSGDAGVPSPVPSAPASPSQPAPSPSATPEPSEPAPSQGPSEPAATPKPPKPTFNERERYLLAGILRGAVDCVPVREDLPPKSGAGIECGSTDPVVARVGFYYFDRDEDMLAAYAARLIREGVELDSGPVCYERASEGPYVPWDGPDMAPLRYGCFVNGEGYANLRITTGEAVYIGILGRTADMEDLYEFAFRGSVDTPSFPTLWGLH